MTDHPEIIASLPIPAGIVRALEAETLAWATMRRCFEVSGGGAEMMRIPSPIPAPPWVWLRTLGLDPDLIEALVDLAKVGNEAMFRELAARRGVAREKLDDMWAGTLRRVGK